VVQFSFCGHLMERFGILTDRPGSGGDGLAGGLRALELCALEVEDLDMKTSKVNVRYGGAEHSNGDKTTRCTPWLYLASREEDGSDPEAQLFIGRYGYPVGRDSLRQLISGLGQVSERDLLRSTSIIWNNHQQSLISESTYSNSELRLYTSVILTNFP
jgi:hypothetical protein